MKPWIKRSLYVVFGATVLAGGLASCGHHGHHGHGASISAEDAARFQARMVERIGKELELDAQQRQRLNLLGDRLREQRTALVGKTTDPRAEVQALVAGDRFDRARAQSIVEEKTTALRSKSPEVIAAAADFYDSLNPGQQQKVRDRLVRRSGWFGRG